MGICTSLPEKRKFAKISKTGTIVEGDINLIIDYVPENSSKVTEDYKILDEILGYEAYGEVRKAVHLATNELRAIKVIFKRKCSSNHQENIFKEIRIMRELDHPNIVKVYEYFHDDHFIFIVMELIHGGELFERIMKVHHFSERKAAEIFQQILTAVNYLHANKVVHRDLKPENILFDGEIIKIIDFSNSSKLKPSQKLKDNRGTVYYIAPEVLDSTYDEKCDVWSCGVILYIMLSGNPPFNGDSEEEILMAIKRGQFNFNFPVFYHISDYAKKFISQMLTYNPKKRISIAEALNDHWFKAVLSKKETSLNSVILMNLKTFHIKSRMQEAIYYFIVNNMANREEKRELMETFKMLDTNNDGVVTKDELIVGLKKANMFISEADVENLMDRIDHNKDRAINYTEFVAAAIDKKRLLSDERLKLCFRIFDKDGSGKISLAEFREVFQGKNKVDPKVWEDLVKEIDIDGDGEIELDEFKTILKKLI